MLHQQIDILQHELERETHANSSNALADAVNSGSHLAEDSEFLISDITVDAVALQPGDEAVAAACIPVDATSSSLPTVHAQTASLGQFADGSASADAAIEQCFTALMGDRMSHSDTSSTAVRNAILTLAPYIDVQRPQKTTVASIREAMELHLWGVGDYCGNIAVRRRRTIVARFHSRLGKLLVDAAQRAGIESAAAADGVKLLLC